MKILTFNTWQEKGPWQKRWEIIFQGLEKYRPEVAAFQEVFNADWAREAQKRAGYGFLVFPPEPSGLMFLSRFPVTQWGSLVMKTQSTTEEYLRYGLFAELEAGENRFAVFNTHLSWRTPESEIRLKQVHELSAFIQEKTGDSECAVMGDFNAAPGTPEIREMAMRGFTDTFASLCPGDPGLTWDNSNPYAAGSNPKMPDRRIDYLFIKNPSKILSGLKSVERVLTLPLNGVFASDHFGLLADFKGESKW